MLFCFWAMACLWPPLPRRACIWVARTRAFHSRNFHISAYRRYTFHQHPSQILTGKRANIFVFFILQTYCVDKQVADSACTSTAYLNGVKANYGTMGINAQVKRGDCLGQNKKEAQTESIAVWAQRSCKAAGLVTTSRVTHASPGGLYARKSS